MKVFTDGTEKQTGKYGNFRHVLCTDDDLQLVLTALRPGEEIGTDIHHDRDQFLRIESGDGEVWIDGVATKISGDDGIIVPAGAEHNVVNTGPATLKLYTISGPS